MIESSPLFVDGLGRRVARVRRDETPVELLYLDPSLSGHPGFEAALRERVTKAAGLRLTSYAKALRVETDEHGGLTLISEYVKGWRLSDLLDVAEAENLTFDIGVVMLLLRQLLPTAAMLASQAKDTASGALGPEHLLLTPQGRLVLTDYVLGPAIETLGWDAERLWAKLRIATPPGAAPRAISPRGDTAQVGVTVLSLVIGRRLRDDEFPERLQVLVGGARQRTPSVVDAPLSDGLRTWLTKALQLHERSFASLFDARRALEQLLATETSLIAQPMELDLAMAKVERLMPNVELPEPPPEVEAPNLLDMPAPAWTLDASVFDAPAPATAADAAPARAAELAMPSLAAFGAVAIADPPMAAPAADLVSVPSFALSAAALASPPAPVPPAVARAAEAPAPAPASRPAAVAAAPAAAGLMVEEFVAAASARPHVEPVPAPVPVAAVEPPPPAVPPPIAPAAEPVRGRFGADTAAEPAESLAAPIAVEVPVWRSPRAVAAMAALVLLQGAGLAWMASRPSEGLGGDGELVLQSRPEGAAVTIDGADHGVTPLTVKVAPGTHVLQLRVGSAEPRVIPLTIRPGVQTAQYVEMQGVAATGVLEVRSEPSSARVTIDGQARGSTPVTLRDVAPGDYQVVLERAGWKSTQKVRVEPGTTAQLVVPIR